MSGRSKSSTQFPRVLIVPSEKSFISKLISGKKQTLEYETRIIPTTFVYFWPEFIHRTKFVEDKGAKNSEDKREGKLIGDQTDKYQLFLILNFSLAFSLFEIKEIVENIAKSSSF